MKDYKNVHTRLVNLCVLCSSLEGYCKLKELEALNKVVHYSKPESLLCIPYVGGYWYSFISPKLQLIFTYPKHSLNTSALNYSAVVKCLILNFTLDYYMISAGLVCKDIMYTFICRNSPVSGAKNALQSIESSPISSHTNLQVHCTIRTTYQNKEETLYLPYILYLVQKRSNLPSKYGKASRVGW